MKNVNNVNVGKIHVQPHEISKKETKETSNIEIKDFKNPATEALGRSQVKSADNLENNILYMMKHPDEVMQANAFFDNAYNTLKAGGVEEAYEKSTQYMDAFKNEFLTK